MNYSFSHLQFQSSGNRNKSNNVGDVEIKPHLLGDRLDQHAPFYFQNFGLVSWNWSSIFMAWKRIQNCRHESLEVTLNESIQSQILM